ncbi:heme peroxidase [Corynespora cassiicola Philippines]|uniref:Peroxidase n=1 Tax=Corynespora cassiicola Philippines TaxID=1448308 RepID=A0A2T2NQJ9_CORCC|nr:heme peroxidase [Corynespora cassiicola Philippines]
MYLQSTLLFGLTASTTAFSLFPRQSNSCPSVWSDVAKDLQADFSGCNGDARGAIRAPFHDCINNGCDGSLILAQEYTRAENAGLSGICTKLGDKAKQFNVGTADMIQFAAAMGIASCQLGPRVRALVGRKDSSVAAPEGSVPSSRDSVDKILGAFGDKGFSAIDVVALMGSHSTARQFFDDPAKAGASLDSTPTVWDVKFYQETTDGTAPYSLASDKKLSNDTRMKGKTANANTLDWRLLEHVCGKPRRLGSGVCGCLG